MRRSVLQVSSLLFAGLLVGTATAQPVPRPLQPTPELVERSLRSVIQRQSALDGSERADPDRVIYGVEIREFKPVSFRVVKEPATARRASVTLKKPIS